MIARITTPWAGDGTPADPFEPLVYREFGPFPMKDVTDTEGQDSTIVIAGTGLNALTVEVEADAVTLRAIYLDDRFTFLWAMNVAEAIPLLPGPKSRRDVDGTGVPDDQPPRGFHGGGGQHTRVRRRQRG